MVRSTAPLLVVVMLLASGRLLACGWECLDQVAVPAEASCHQESAPVTALNGDAAHACLPDVAEPRVTVAKAPAAQSLMAAPPLTAVVTTDPLLHASRHRFHPGHIRSALPPAPSPAVLRV